MKIKYTLIEKLPNLNKTEMNLFFHMVKSQNQNTGIVEGVYYRDVIKHTGMCKQSFYNAIRGLEEKQIIRVEKNSEVDYDVCILGNAFPTDRERKEGYVSLNRKAFHQKAFKKLKAHEKYLLLEFLKGTHENTSSMCLGKKRFYEKFKEILGVSKRVLRGYLHSLKLFFSIGVKNGKYYITYLHSVFQKLKQGDSDWRAERSWYLESMVKKECHRKHITYDAESLQDTAYFAIQYQNYADSKKELMQALMHSIGESIQGNAYGSRELNSKYIHKLMRKELGLPASV